MEQLIIYIVGVLSSFAIIYARAYVVKSAECKAEKNYTGAITEESEHVKTKFAKQLEETKVNHQLRLAAIDRRLQAHQDAFALWRKLLRNVHGDEVGKVVMECQAWWENNCLFLEPSVREAFSSAYTSANSHQAFIQSGHKDMSLINENWQRIISPGEEIISAVELPGLTITEKKELAELVKTNTKG